MTFTIYRDSRDTARRRVYRIECPDNTRIYTSPVDAQETILIPGPEHRSHPERSVWLRSAEAIGAAREGRYGLRLLDDGEAVASRGPS